MDIILVPGLWLDASSWAAVAPALIDAGHRVHPLTMPGVGVPAEHSADIGITDWVDAVVGEIDRVDAPVVLVGHSGGGNVVWAAADRRPDLVTRVVLVDTFPPGDGGTIWEFPVVGGVVPFPGWGFFDDAEVADLTEQTRAATRLLPVPERVPTDPVRLLDPRRHNVPVTMLSGTVPAAEIRGYIDEAPPWAAELGAVRDLTIVELHSGHWPQLSDPEAVAAAIAEAAADRD